MLDRIAQLLSFLEHGGHVLWIILALSLLMWTLILERYLYFSFTVPQLRRELHEQWSRHWQAWRADEEHHWLLRRIGADYTAEYTLEIGNNLRQIRTLMGILPLLGLLGTVSGMIKTFDVITVFGTGNVRGLATGISEALITTMAGLLTALSGLYFSSHLDARARDERRKLEKLLKRC